VTKPDDGEAGHKQINGSTGPTAPPSNIYKAQRGIGQILLTSPHQTPSK